MRACPISTSRQVAFYGGYRVLWDELGELHIAVDVRFEPALLTPSVSPALGSSSMALFGI
jgi:hypothetical protein